MNIPWEAMEGLAVYIIGSTVGFVWWMATMTTTLQFVREDLVKANKTLAGFESLYATKSDMQRVESMAQAAHRRIDEIKK